jgi:hypothetical protein
MKTSTLLSLSTAAAVLAMTPSATSQAYAFDMPGCSTVVPIHDMNGDGTPELAVGTSAQSRVFLVNGETGVPLRVMRRTGGFGASMVVVDDMDGDGKPELLVGAPTTDVNGSPRGTVHLVSLGTGTTLWISAGSATDDHMGTAVAVIGDLDGDGKPEMAAGAPQFPVFDPNRNGRVYILSGASGVRLGALLPQGLSPDFEAAQFGQALTTVADMGSDGVSELVVGMPGFAFSGPGKVTVHDSATLLGPQAPALLELANGLAGFGASLASPGDLSGDGTGDLLVGAMGGMEPGDDDGGAVLYSGADGASLMELRSSVNTLALGEAVAAPGDLDGDGVGDLMAAGLGSVFFGESRVVLAVSGANGDTIFEDIGPSKLLETRVSIGTVGDLTGDGRPEFSVSDCETDTMTVRSMTPLWYDLGFGQAGGSGVPELSGAGDPSGPADLVLTLSGAGPDLDGILFAGGAFGGTPFQGGVLVPVPDITFIHVGTDGTGTSVMNMNWPEGSLGPSAFFQVWLTDPSAPHGRSASNGLRGEGT